jgi:hypothetical protein
MSNESMANYITDTPSEIAELLATNKELEQRLQKWDEVVKVCNELKDIQGREGTFNYSPQDQAMYNGMEFMISIMEGREPNFREAPKKWLQEGKFKTLLRKIFNIPKYKVVACNKN